ncbi:hypothetical protein BY458DRAFT_552569 [Sporodiniella umbellata]|nr:hypothetical protein BY458DRAFT_552569 [Sporodiniella umbellata]
MLLLKHNTLSVEELFTIECKMIKVMDREYELGNLQDFEILNKSRAELYGYILGFSERMGLCESIGVTPSEFLDFVVDVDQGYLPNAYHSFYHAVDVAVVLYQMIYQYDVARYLSRIDLAGLFIAGLCHDIGHPGKNNNFQVNLQTDLAKRYSNKSVLESFSCTLTIDLLGKHKLFRNLEQTSSALGLCTTEPELKTAIIKMILATDMIFHYELQENLANLLEIVVDHELEPLLPTLPVTAEEREENHEITPTEPEIKDIFSNQGAKSAITYFRKKSYFEDSPLPFPSRMPASPPLDPPGYRMDAHQRLILCQIILHAADISNALRPWPLCRHWSDLVCEEFFGQGDAERDQRLPVSPNMDRNQVSQTTIGLSFGDFVVSPYFEIFSALFPKADELLKTLNANRAEWILLEQEDLRTEEQHPPEKQPAAMLPEDRPILNPTGRRVSVAAGMVIIPDQLEERTVGSGKNKRKFWGVRSISHGQALDPLPRADASRRRSEEPIQKLKSVIPLRRLVKKKIFKPCE